MTDSLQAILSGRVPQEPTVVVIIKRFIRDELKADCGVIVGQKQIVIQVRSAALAGALQPHLNDLKHVLETTSRLVIRIG